MLTTRISQPTLQQQYEEKLERIRNHKKRNAKLMLEDVWDKFAHIRLKSGEDVAFSMIFQNNIVISLIKNTAKSYWMAWKKNSRLTLEDFESVIYEKAWKIIDNYTPHQKWYLYEQLTKGLKQPCIDLLRQQGLTETRINKHTYFHHSLSLTLDTNEEREVADTINIESETVLKLWMEKELNQIEYKVAKLQLVDVNTNTTDICFFLGLKHRQQATRIRNSIRKKASSSVNIL